MDLNQMTERTRERSPDAPAVVFRNETLNYRELFIRVDRLAASLTGLGISTESRVAIVMRNSPEFIITYFAVIRCGGIAVPINFLLKPREIEYILRDAGAVGVATQQEFFDNAGKAAENVSSVKFIITSGKTPLSGPGGKSIQSFEHLTARQDTAPSLPDRTAEPEATAMFIYTSGTTGKPKGVILTHANLIANIRSCTEMIDITPADRFICVLPMFHSFAWLVCVLLPIHIGARIIVIESVKPFSRVMKAVFRHKITIFSGVPQIFAALSKLPMMRLLNVFIPIRVCISGAAPLHPDVLDRFQKKFGIPLLEGYGLTETSPVASLNPLKGKRKKSSVGIPIPGVEVKIIGEDGRKLPRGKEVGEICIRGPNVMKGYYNLPDETAEVLSKDGWFRSGDLGSIDEDGYIFIVGRQKDLIISKGLNIYPKEVEDVLETHPAVAEAAVIGIPRQDGDETVIAYVILQEGKKLPAGELIRFCRDRIASYKAPREIIIVKEFPKNTLGKVLKTKLRDEAVKRFGNR